MYVAVSFDEGVMRLLSTVYFALSTVKTLCAYCNTPSRALMSTNPTAVCVDVEDRIKVDSWLTYLLTGL